MMNNFAAAIMLAIGAYAGDYASDAKRFTGADLRSLDAFKYGKFVTSMKASMAKGTASAFYLLGEGDKKVFDQWSAMCIVPSVEDSLVTRINFNALNEDWATQDCGEEGYHTYEIEWTPTYISYHYDGQEIRRREGVAELNKDQHLVMSILALQGEDHGNVDPEELPVYTAFDYVEVYSYDEANDNFNLKFREDFNSAEYNSYLERWHYVTDYTWDAINSNQVQENVSFDGEALVLKLDKNPNYGHHDDHDDDKDEKSDDEDSDHDDHESDSEHEDFHVLPAPKEGTLDRAIENATRVAVTMVRTYLDDFSENMGHYLNQ